MEGRGPVCVRERDETEWIEDVQWTTATSPSTFLRPSVLVDLLIDSV